MKEIIDIEKLLWWVYQDQAADAVVQADLRQMFPQAYRSGMAALLRHEQLGCMIDCAGSVAYAARNIHPDAEVVHDAVMNMAPIDRGLVIMHAKCGDRPDAMEGEEPRLGPMKRGNRLVVEKLNKRPLFCYITWEVSQENIDFARGVYRSWWEAVANLADMLEDRLEDFMVSGPSAPQCPWSEKKVDGAHFL